MGNKKDKRVMRPVECCANCDHCYAQRGPGEPHSYYCGLDESKPERTVKDFEWLPFKETDPRKAEVLRSLFDKEIEAEIDWFCKNRIESEFTICQYYKQDEYFIKRLKDAIG